MRTLEQVRAKIRRNFPAADAPDPKPLLWDRETMTTMVSSCGRFRISRAHAPDDPKSHNYTAFTTPGSHGPARKIAGPFATPKQCRDAVQDFVNGEPMQADLA